ncbi:MAG: 2-hydroxyacyl-CoA dehydratase subunit D [Thermoleophilia bacterium]
MTAGLDGSRPAAPSVAVPPEAGARALARFRAVAADPRAELAAIKERTGLMAVGYFDSYLPEELIMAHGLVPYRVIVEGREDVRSMEFIQGYACPASRDLLDQALRGDLNLLDGALFSRYCDSLRGVYAVWDSEKLTPYVDFVRYPTVVNTGGAVAYLAKELQEVSGRMATALDAPVDERRLLESIAACNRKRGLVAELAARRAAREPALSGADYLAVLVAATTMLPDDFTTELSALLAHPPAGEPGDAVPVVLSGVTFDNVALAAVVEAAGLYLIADDLSTGSRWYGVRVETATLAGGEGSGAYADPWEALAHAYLTRPPCSVKEPSSPRADHLLAQVRRSGARGVVFYLTRYCDSEQVEWPYIRDRLAAEGIPAFMVEGEHKSGATGALATRLEAFRERLEQMEEEL